MAKGRRALMAPASARAGDRTIGALRPGVEAILLAAVALGCAQTGWQLVTPRYATAASPAPNDDIEATPTLAASADFVSPFAPEGSSAGGGSSAASAIIENLRVVGLRMSADPARSGAIVDQGGKQTALSVGDDLGAGIELVAVREEGIEVSVAGARRIIAVDGSSAGPSFALAVMGLTAVDAVSQVEVAANETFVVEPKTVSPALLAGMGAPEFDAAGAMLGWRVSQAVPAAASAAGLKPGDLVVSVNGAPPNPRATGQLQSPITLTVHRAGEPPSTIRFEVGAPT